MKEIQLYLFDDTINGDKQYCCGDYSMICIKRGSDNLKDYQSSGVYMLFEENCNRRKIYIGQTSNIANRIKQHDAKKDFWDEAVFFKQDYREFTRTETEWLEEQLIKMVIDSNMYDVIQNYQIPKKVVVNESDEARLSKDIEMIKLFLDIYGLHLTKKNTSQEKHSEPSSKTIVDRIAKSYKYLPDTSNYGYSNEDDGIIHIIKDNIDATYFDMGNGKIIICKGSLILKTPNEYIDKIQDNILLKDIIVNSEKDAIKLIEGWE